MYPKYRKKIQNRSSLFPFVYKPLRSRTIIIITKVCFDICYFVFNTDKDTFNRARSINEDKPVNPGTLVNLCLDPDPYSDYVSFLETSVIFAPPLASVFFMT